jgi:hypothetical protein
MLNLFGRCLKFALFVFAVLAAGSWIEWRGRTLSDHVATGLSQARHVGVPAVGAAASGIAERAKEVASGFSLREASSPRPSSPAPPKRLAKARTPASAEAEAGAHDIPESERQKLRSLIRELNGSRTDGR